MLKLAFSVCAIAVAAAYLAPTGIVEPVTATPSLPRVTGAIKIAKDGAAETTLTRSSDGHFYADARINGTVIRVLVDTGASIVALTREDALKIGLIFSEKEFTDSAQTAGGKVALKSVTLDHVALGPVEASKVDAAIAGPELHQSLLGQSWLQQVGEVTIKGDVMTLH
jgi:aspartyl protease family protein